MSQLIEKKLAELDCLVTEFDKEKKTVLVCHGYGASKEDLAGLLPYIEDAESFNWVFPDAPLTIPISPMMSGRAWFPISMETLERAMLEGKDAVYQNLVPDGMQEAVDHLKAIVKELNVEEDKLIVAGFSQGSMVLTHLALRSFNKALNGVILMSSTLIAEQLLEKKDFNLDILQSHGTEDPVLPFNGAKMLEGKLASFRASHRIPSFYRRA